MQNNDWSTFFEEDKGNIDFKLISSYSTAISLLISLIEQFVPVLFQSWDNDAEMESTCYFILMQTVFFIFLLF